MQSSGAYLPLTYEEGHMRTEGGGYIAVLAKIPSKDRIPASQLEGALDLTVPALHTVSIF